MINQDNELEIKARSPSIGQNIAGYQVIQRIEESTVYLGHRDTPPQTVAFKLFFPDPYACNREYILERLNEICQLDHENILRVYATGETEQFIYAITEYVPGQNLYDLMQRNPRLHWAAAAELARDIVQGLVAAHAKGVAHRCLHPDRILLSKSGYVKLNFCNEGEITPSKEVANFVAPELFLGQDLNQQSDIYSVGTIIYTIVTGKAPLSGKNPKDIATKHREMESVLPAYGVADIPHSLSLIIERSLCKDLQQRYKYSYELAAALKNFLINDIGNYKIGSYKELFKAVEDTINIQIPEPTKKVQVTVEQTEEPDTTEAKSPAVILRQEMRRFWKNIFPLSPAYWKIVAGCSLALASQIALLLCLK